MSRDYTDRLHRAVEKAQSSRWEQDDDEYTRCTMCAMEVRTDNMEWHTVGRTDMPFCSLGCYTQYTIGRRHNDN